MSSPQSHTPRCGATSCVGRVAFFTQLLWTTVFFQSIQWQRGPLRNRLYLLRLGAGLRSQAPPCCSVHLALTSYLPFLLQSPQVLGLRSPHPFLYYPTLKYPLLRGSPSWFLGARLLLEGSSGRVVGQANRVLGGGGTCQEPVLGGGSCCFASICLIPNIGCGSRKEEPQWGKQRQLGVEVTRLPAFFHSLSVTLGRVTS